MDLGRHALLAGFDRLAIAEVTAFARNSQAAGYDRLWVPETFGRESFALLGHLATVTPGLPLGLGVALVYSRDPVTTRAGAATLQEMTGGRFAMGFGVGHRETVTGGRGHEYAPPLRAMREFIARYHAARYDGPRQFGDPPLVVAARRLGMLRQAVQEGAAAYAYLMPLSYVAWARRELDDAAVAAGAPRPTLLVSVAARVDENASSARAAAARYLGPYLRLANYRAHLEVLGYAADELGDPPASRVIDDLVAWGQAESVRDRLRAFLAAGADGVTLVPLDEQGGMADRSVMEQLAPPW